MNERSSVLLGCTWVDGGGGGDARVYRCPSQREDHVIRTTSTMRLQASGERSISQLSWPSREPCVEYKFWLSMTTRTRENIQVSSKICLTP